MCPFSYSPTLSGVTITFERAQYNVSEGDQQTICAVVTSAAEGLQGDIEVFVNSSDITANGTHVTVYMLSKINVTLDQVSSYNCK